MDERQKTVRLNTLRKRMSDKRLAEKHKKELVNLAIEKARNAVRKTAESNGCKRSYSS
jgi:hypothetical protein